jgi:thiamine-phosphate pyrophosphorylase
MCSLPARIDVSLYAIVDEELLEGRSAAAVAAELAASGATVVQYRAKRLSSREFLGKARAIRGALAVTHVPLIINDRADIALLCGANGVHVGADDIPVADARKIMGAGALVGATALTAADALKAEQEGADYVGAGAVYATLTKSDAPLIGLEGLKEVRASVRLPVVAIGGLTLGNAAEALATGVDGLAFISELMNAASPGEAARQLRAMIDASRRTR